MKKLLSAAVLSLLPFTASADFIGFAVGAAYWNPSPSGDISYRNYGSNDFKDDLNLEDARENVLWAVLEHPLPMLPNVKLVRTSLGLDGDNGTLRATFGDISGGLPGVDSTIGLDQLDLMLYYEVLDNWLTLDLGIDIKRFDGSARLSSPGASAREDVSAMVPLLYGNAMVELPFTGFFAGLEAAGLTVGDNSVSDITARVGYESDIGLGAMAGLRSLSVNLEDSDVTVDFTVSGPFIAVYYDF